MSGIQTIEPGAETQGDREQSHDEPLYVGEPIPAVCHIADLCRIFQRSRTYVFAHRRSFDKFLLTGSTDEWSGYRIAQHLRAGAPSITVKRS